MNTSPRTEIMEAQSPFTSSAASFRHRRSRRQNGSHAKSAACGNEEKELAADEKAEVEKKIVVLQKIVPGGERLPVEELFEETAEYIFALQSQVEALRFLSAFVQTSDQSRNLL